MSNPVLGHLNCPHCGEEATIHQEKKGQTKALYYRCINCGTIQCRYGGGQKFIKENARWIAPDDTETKEKIAAQAAAEAKAEVTEALNKVKKEDVKTEQKPETAEHHGKKEKLKTSSGWLF